MFGVSPGLSFMFVRFCFRGLGRFLELLLEHKVIVSKRYQPSNEAHMDARVLLSQHAECLKRHPLSCGLQFRVCVPCSTFQKQYFNIDV